MNNNLGLWCKASLVHVSFWLLKVNVVSFVLLVWKSNCKQKALIWGKNKIGRKFVFAKFLYSPLVCFLSYTRQNKFDLLLKSRPWNTAAVQPKIKKTSLSGIARQDDPWASCYSTGNNLEKYM